MKRGCFFVVILVLTIFIVDLTNISDILSIPLYNINLDLWNIVIVIVLYVTTYAYVDKRDNDRKKNQEAVAKRILKQTYNECYQYIKLFDDRLFKEACQKRFPGNQTMENNTAYHNLREAPFEHDSMIYSFAQEGVISVSEIQNYINVKSKYHVYFSNVICFTEVDEIIAPLKYELEEELNKAISEL